jgi:hypothetical protein
MAVLNGTSVVLGLGGIYVNGVTDQSFDAAVDEIEITTKDSDGAKEFMAGEDSYTGSISGLLDPADTYTYEELITALQAKAAIAFVYGAGVITSGAELTTGSVIITGLTRQDPKNAASTWTANVRITGRPTYGTSATTLVS